MRASLAMFTKNLALLSLFFDNRETRQKPSWKILFKSSKYSHFSSALYSSLLDGWTDTTEERGRERRRQGPKSRAAPILSWDGDCARARDKPCRANYQLIACRCAGRGGGGCCRQGGPVRHFLTRWWERRRVEPVLRAKARVDLWGRWGGYLLGCSNFCSKQSQVFGTCFLGASFSRI
jgi:hypothetical protein